MASGSRAWPVVLLVGLCLSVGAGTAAALAAPSDSGRPWWHDDAPQRVTGTVVGLDHDTLTLDGLVSYDPVHAGIGTLVVAVDDPGDAVIGDTVDIDVTRHDGGWTAPSIIVLDPD